MIVLITISLVVLAFLTMPRPPRRWNGETDPDRMHE